MPRDKHTSSRAPGRARTTRAPGRGGRSAAGHGMARRPPKKNARADKKYTEARGGQNKHAAANGQKKAGRPAAKSGQNKRPAAKAAQNKRPVAKTGNTRPVPTKKTIAAKNVRNASAAEEIRLSPVASFAPESAVAGSAPKSVSNPPAGKKSAQVASDEDGIRVDRWFKRHYPALTHGMLEKMLRTGQIRVNGKRIRAKDRMMVADEVRLPPQLIYGELEHKRDKPAALKMDGRDLQDQVIYMDGNVIVINKPSGLATQGGSGLTKHVDGMLDDLMFEKKTRPKLVHRLDKDTSGVLVIARNASSAAILSKSLAERDASKVYWALTKGIPKPRRGIIKAALVKEGGHGPRGRDERMMVTEESTPGAKAAATSYAVMGEAGEYAWVACKPLTGRTHQIRVHMASIGTPIVGDFKYGGTSARGYGEIEDRLHLHARMIDMAAPDQVRLHVVAELPEHMQKAWALFGFDPDCQDDPFAKRRKR